MDELFELDNSADTIRDFVSEKLKGLSESFSILTVGHITKFVEPINCKVGVSEAFELFAADPEVSSIPVEGDRGVIGLLNKNTLLKKRKAIMSVTDPPVEKFLDDGAFSVDASENCEKAMEQLLKGDPERLYDDFMIYQHGRFFGVGSFADLSRNIASIRSVDLEKAKKMQEFLMSRNAVANPGIVVEKYVKMAHEVGGDFLQCMDLGSGLSMLSSFDVSGKGTAAALLTSILSSFFSTLKISGAFASHDAASVLGMLNKVIIDQTPEEVFIAGAFVFVDREKREVTFFNCGFSPIFAFFTDEETGKTKGKIIKSSLWPLGIHEFEDLSGNVFPIYKNLRVFMYSDGLTDARDSRGDQYGEENLKKFLFPKCMQKAKALVASLDEEISAFVGAAPQADDITVLVAEIS
jgi:serine phosphatase RsbU (regulator of sigma subunit)